MATTASTDWAERIKTMDNLFGRGAIAECIEKASDMLHDPLLPSLYGIKCHIVLGKASIDMTERRMHKDTAEQLWALSASYWREESRQATVVCEIQQELFRLAECTAGHNLSGLEDSFGSKRCRSQAPSPAVSKRVKIESFTPELAQETGYLRSQNREQIYSDHTICQSIERYEPIAPFLPSRSYSHFSGEGDVKYASAVLDKEFDRLETNNAFDRYGPRSTPPCLLASSMSYSSVRLEAPKTPRLALLTSPLGPTPSPLFAPDSSPSPPGDYSRAPYTPPTTSLADNTVKDISHIVRSPMDDECGPADSQQTSHSWLKKVKHDRDISVFV